MTARDALALVTINLLWGASYVVTKDALGTMPPLTLAFARFALAWAVFALGSVPRGRIGPRSSRWPYRPPELTQRSSRTGPHPPTPSPNSGRGGVWRWAIFLPLAQNWERGPGGEGHSQLGHGETEENRQRIEQRQALLIPMVGLLGFCLDYVFFYHGLRLTTASDAAILVNMEAIFTALLGAGLLRERIGGRAAWGILAACVGAVLLLRPEGGAAGDRRALGNTLILAALVCEALATVLSRPLRRHRSPLDLTRRFVGWGAVGLLPLALYEATRAPHPTLWLTPAVVAGVVYLALGCTVFCYSVWYGLLGRIEAGRAAVFLYVQPIVGVALGVAIQGDRLAPSLILGGVLIGTGIAAVSRPSNMRQ